MKLKEKKHEMALCLITAGYNLREIGELLNEKKQNIWYWLDTRNTHKARQALRNKTHFQVKIVTIGRWPIWERVGYLVPNFKSVASSLRKAQPVLLASKSTLGRLNCSPNAVILSQQDYKHRVFLHQITNKIKREELINRLRFSKKREEQLRRACPFPI